jgi:hypothetical protein
VSLLLNDDSHGSSTKQNLLLIAAAAAAIMAKVGWFSYIDVAVGADATFIIIWEFRPKKP